MMVGSVESKIANILFYFCFETLLFVVAITHWNNELATSIIAI